MTDQANEHLAEQNDGFCTSVQIIVQSTLYSQKNCSAPNNSNRDNVNNYQLKHKFDG